MQRAGRTAGKTGWLCSRDQTCLCRVNQRCSQHGRMTPVPTQACVLLLTSDLLDPNLTFLPKEEEEGENLMPFLVPSRPLVPF